MQALAAARLQEVGEAQLVEHGVHQRRRLLHRLPAHALAGVEVEGHAVGLLDVGALRVPGVELDHVHLRGADERGERIDLDHRRVAGVE